MLHLSRQANHFVHKIVIIFLSFGLNISFWCSKEPLSEMVLLSTHNICFGWELRFFFFDHPLLSGGLGVVLVYTQSMCVGMFVLPELYPALDFAHYSGT